MLTELISFNVTLKPEYRQSPPLEQSHIPSHKQNKPDDNPLKPINYQKKPNKRNHPYNNPHNLYAGNDS